MLHSKPNRRQVLELCIARGLLVAGIPALSRPRLFALWQGSETPSPKKPTPQDVLGPFFRKGAPNQPVLRAAGDPGFPLKVSGVVMNNCGKLVEGAKVELWHADHTGRYDTRGYKYRAKLSPDAKGAYGVETVMPGHYADRPAQHIHYLISAPGHKTLITQAYFATDPYFEGDPDKNWQKGHVAGNRELILPVKLFEGGVGPSAEPAHAEIVFDLVLEQT